MSISAVQATSAVAFSPKSGGIDADAKALVARFNEAVRNGSFKEQTQLFVEATARLYDGDKANDETRKFFVDNVPAEFSKRQSEAGRKFADATSSRLLATADGSLSEALRIHVEEFKKLSSDERDLIAASGGETGDQYLALIETRLEVAQIYDRGPAPDGTVAATGRPGGPRVNHRSVEALLLEFDAIGGGGTLTGPVKDKRSAWAQKASTFLDLFKYDSAVRVDLSPAAKKVVDGA